MGTGGFRNIGFTLLFILAAVICVAFFGFVAVNRAFFQWGKTVERIIL